MVVYFGVTRSTLTTPLFVNMFIHTTWVTRALNEETRRWFQDTHLSSSFKASMEFLITGIAYAGQALVRTVSKGGKCLRHNWMEWII